MQPPKTQKEKKKEKKNPLIVNEILFQAVCDNFTYFQVKCDSQLICWSMAVMQAKSYFTAHRFQIYLN